MLQNKETLTIFILHKKKFHTCIFMQVLENNFIRHPVLRDLEDGQINVRIIIKD